MGRLMASDEKLWITPAAAENWVHPDSMHYDDDAPPRNFSPLPSQTPCVPGLVTERLLGIGGRSSVWLVRQGPSVAPTLTWAGENPPRTLALKVPLGALRTAPPLRSAQRELEAMLPLMHQYLVRPWGVVRTSDGQPGLLLQPFTAGSLAQLQRAVGVLNAGECVTAVSPIAQALAHLHESGAAHGDVTAANILLTPEGRPALGDLGDSVLLGMDSAHGTPESDVKSLAAVAWSCLTGREPESVDRRPPLQSLVPGVSDQFTELLEAALSATPSQRPLAGEFAADLHECASPEPLDILSAADDHALTEVPTVIPQMRLSSPGRSAWKCLIRRLRILVRGPARRRVPAH